MTTAIVTIAVIAVAMLVMAVGVILKGKCLSGSCGGPKVVGPGGELQCGTCGRHSRNSKEAEVRDVEVNAG